MARSQRSAQPLEDAASANPWRIGIYLRLSREDGQDESQSVTNQRKIIDDFLAKEFGGRTGVVDVFMDDGLSGTDDSRAEFMRLITYIEERKVNCVICKTLSRAFRNYADQGYYLESYFPQKKVRFISLSDPTIDTYKNPDALTGFEVPIIGVVNDRYAAMTSNAVRRTFAMKQEKGEFIGAFPPYGFLKDPNDKNRLILDPDTVPIKHRVKDWLIQEGLSLRGAVMRLNDLGIPNPTAYKQSKGWRYHNPHALDSDGYWNAATLKRMLLSQNNIGHMVQGKQRVISYKVHTAESVTQSGWKIAYHVIEPTFTQEEYDTLTRLLSRDTRAAGQQAQTHLFSGFLRCADCQKAMHRKASGPYVYYYCRTYKEKNRCTKHTFSEKELAGAVLEALRCQIIQFDSLPGILSAVQALHRDRPQAALPAKLLQEKEKELAKVERLLEGLYMDLKAGVLDPPTYGRLKENLTRQGQQLAKAAIALREERQKQTSHDVPESEVFRAFREHRSFTGLDRAALNEMVEGIWVHEGKRVTIRFRYAEDGGRGDG